jgi:MOSC domain-containing protein YiiM
MTISEGRLEAIWIKRMHRGPMDLVDSAELIAARGIVGNADQGGKRQVTIIEQEAWDELMRTLGASLSPSSRRANLVVSGIRLTNTRGHILRIGSCRIQINGETRPCEQLEKALTGLKQAMYGDWRGGVYGEILDNAHIAIGNPVFWDAFQPAPTLFQRLLRR